ncbi:MAG: PilN domain-containing protein [Candidatus Omnitrophica bacterium]|nr:PilN domain-containing protein [Candidatus Omnitrophota bacterium]
MLKINLLPEGARKAAVSPIEQFHRTPIMWLLVGGMVLCVLWLFVPITLHRQQLRQLQAKIHALEPRKREVDQLQRFLQRLRSQEQAFRGLGAGQSLWSKRFNILSDVTPEGVWFTELSLEQGKGLMIQGSAIGLGGAEMVSIGRLVQDLKTNPDFASVVKDIQIESIKRVQEKEIELAQFTLTCALQEAPAPR